MLPTMIQSFDEGQIAGTDGGDVLTGTDADNSLVGGAGDDTLNGGFGNDNYIINTDDGVDTIIDDGGIDTIQFGAGITADSLSLGLGSLLVRYGNGQDGIHIEGFDPANAQGTPIIENFRFADGSSLTYEQLLARGFDLTGSGNISGTSVNDRITGSEIQDVINAGAGDDLVLSLAGDDMLNSGLGRDILQSGAGDDTLTDIAGNNLLDGGAGTDTLIGGDGNNFLAGGSGNDTIITGSGSDIIAYNLSDGVDTITASSGNDTLSLGKGIGYSGFAFSKSGNDLNLNTSNGIVVLKDWYTNNNGNHIDNLQIIIEGTNTYNPASSSQLYNKKVQLFDFAGLAAKFDQAIAAAPNLPRWSLSSSALMEFYLGGSDTAAIGGDLAYQYAMNGSLSTMSMTPAQELLASPSFGTAAQNLQSSVALQNLSPRLI